MALFLQFGAATSAVTHRSAVAPWACKVAGACLESVLSRRSKVRRARCPGVPQGLLFRTVQTTASAWQAGQSTTTVAALHAAMNADEKFGPNQAFNAAGTATGIAMTFRPKYISFDCYGTLIRFHMGELTREMFADRVPAERMEQFIADFSAYRYDEVLGAWQPYDTVLKNAVRRLCRKWKLQYQDHEAQAYCTAVPTWGPHADVPAGLAKVAREIPLVILSNAMDADVQKNVSRLGAPFYRVYTAQQAQAYKPRFQAFEYMIDSLGCNPEDLLHVSSSLRYDLVPADDMGIVNKVFVNRGHGPANPAYRYTEIADIGGLAGVVGL
jgi:2-haloacid dehalogenase